MVKWKILKLAKVLSVSIFLSSIFITPLSSFALNIQEVPNPRQVSGGWVTDMADILSEQTENQLNQMISQLEAANGAEIAVVTVPQTISEASVKEFTTKLFNYWGIGKKGQDNGILFLISVQNRRVEIETGSGLESILPDTKVGHIIDTEIIPRFRQGNFDNGTLAGTKALIIILEPSLKAELNQHQPISSTDSTQPSPQPTLELIWGLLLGASVSVLTIATIIIHFNSRVFLEPTGRSQRTQRSNDRIYCSECKQLMQQVDNSLVQTHLNKIDQVAQRIGSIEFAGWKCSNCSQEDFHLIGWISKSNEFQTCPHCRGWTVKRSKKILVPATEYQHGVILITDICESEDCNYFHQEEEIIPPLPPPVIHSASSYDSSSGSDSSGGGSSFGGGSSGGGGAGGDW